MGWQKSWQLSCCVCNRIILIWFESSRCVPPPRQCYSHHSWLRACVSMAMIPLSCGQDGARGVFTRPPHKWCMVVCLPPWRGRPLWESVRLWYQTTCLKDSLDEYALNWTCGCRKTLGHSTTMVADFPNMRCECIANQADMVDNVFIKTIWTQSY